MATLISQSTTPPDIGRVNPILAAVRADIASTMSPTTALGPLSPEERATVYRAWLLALEENDSPDTPTGDIAEWIREAVGSPAGPGWEDAHYYWSRRITAHAERVLRLLVNVGQL